MLGNIFEYQRWPLKRVAKSIIGLSDEQIRQLIESGQFEEVRKVG